MFKLYTILSLYAILIQLVFSDDFLILSHPESVAFEASKAVIPIKQMKHILRAVIAESVSTGAEFTALKITNIFKIPKTAYIVNVKLDSTPDYTALGAKAQYTIDGRIPGASLQNVFKFTKSQIFLEFYKTSKDAEFDYLKKLLTKAKVIGGDEVVPELQKLLTADVVEKITVDIKKNYIVTHISNKKIPLDFSKLNDAITKIKAIAGEIFVALLTYGPDSSIPLTENKNISTITTIDPTDHRHYNIPPRYDENYAIIFNIILWFMVAFSLSLYTMILAMINMDPGRNSIIYRMTATRSKKDI
uniref:Renin receptor n=1 Tax=Ceratitis capitata TaxID=7213 RepID=W8B507_CERCA